MGKEVLKHGAFAFTDGSTFYSYGITSQDLTKTVSEADLTDTFSPGLDREYKTGRREVLANINLWKQVDEADPPINTLMTEVLIDFEGYVYYGQAYLTELGNAASIDEGISQAYAMRFTGQIWEAMDNLIIDAGGYGTTDWSNPGANFVIGSGVSLVAAAYGEGDNYGINEVTNAAAGAGQFGMQQAITFPGTPDETLVMFHVFQADQDVHFDSDTGLTLTEVFPATAKRMLYFKKLSFNALRTLVRLSLAEPVSNGEKLIIDNFNLFQINP